MGEWRYKWMSGNMYFYYNNDRAQWESWELRHSNKQKKQKPS